VIVPLVVHLDVHMDNRAVRRDSNGNHGEEEELGDQHRVLCLVDWLVGWVWQLRADCRMKWSRNPVSLGGPV
jgi:hypothetical protein